VVDVGAGTGSYESGDRRCVAVDASGAMLRQRRPGAAPAVQAAAERLPFPDGAFDAALAVLTLHHWDDRAAGLAEMRRVARRRAVVLTWDPAARDAFWLTADYLPQIVELDVGRFPPLAEIARAFTGARAEPVLVPHDCQDGFLGAFWRRPEAYLVPAVRRAMSGFAQLPPGVVDEGLARLEDDLRSGRWHARHGDLAGRDAADLGYRLLVLDTR